MNDLLAAARAARKRSPLAKSTEERINAATSRLKGNRAALVEERASQIPESQLTAYLKAVRGKSLRAAVNAFCAECVGWERQAVRECTGLACPLWPYRPFQRK